MHDLGPEFRSFGVVANQHLVGLAITRRLGVLNIALYPICSIVVPQLGSLSPDRSCSGVVRFSESLL